MSIAKSPQGKREDSRPVHASCACGSVFSSRPSSAGTRGVLSADSAPASQRSDRAGIVVDQRGNPDIAGGVCHGSETEHPLGHISLPNRPGTRRSGSRATSAARARHRASRTAVGAHQGPRPADPAGRGEWRSPTPRSGRRTRQGALLVSTTAGTTRSGLSRRTSVQLAGRAVVTRIRHGPCR